MADLAVLAGVSGCMDVYGRDCVRQKGSWPNDGYLYLALEIGGSNVVPSPAELPLTIKGADYTPVQRLFVLGSRREMIY